jgi:hypothetical protein
MHAALKEADASAASTPLQSERGVLLEEFIRSMLVELTTHARKLSEPVTASAAPRPEADEPSATSVPLPSPIPAPLLSIFEPSSAHVHESGSAEEAEDDDDDDQRAGIGPASHGKRETNQQRLGFPDNCVDHERCVR